MAIVTISEAARLTGKSRKTIQRYVADGRVSMSQLGAGEKGIDISELVRVFGQLSQSVPALSHVPMSQAVAPDVSALETRIKVLEEQLSAKDAVLAEKERNIVNMETAMRLLENHSAPRPWWRLGR